MSGSTLLVDPVAPAATDVDIAPLAVKDLRGKVVGFVDNAKPNFNLLVDDLADILTKDYGVAKVIKYRKPGQVPVGDKVLDPMAEECDTIITGSGD
jgi:hypothetical protein